MKIEANKIDAVTESMLPYRPDSFPKVCGCGRTYDRAAWEKMRHAGVMVGASEGRRYFDDLEMRHCACDSTISVRLATVQEVECS